MVEIVMMEMKMWYDKCMLYIYKDDKKNCIFWFNHLKLEIFINTYENMLAFSSKSLMGMLGIYKYEMDVDFRTFLMVLLTIFYLPLPLFFVCGHLRPME